METKKLTAPVGAVESNKRRNNIEKPKALTTNEQIFIRMICGRIYNGLYPIEGRIALK
jgi:hypothetical protein